MLMWGQPPSAVRQVTYPTLARCEYPRIAIIETPWLAVLSPFLPGNSTRPATNAKDASLYQFFAPGGILSRTHPAYEFRRGQLQMAQAVEQALEEKRHLIVEAGTGTGKTLAYLLPVIRSGKRVIISTGTKNLQEQLFTKTCRSLSKPSTPDPQTVTAPWAVQPVKLSVCYMKGRNNYLCRKKLYDLTDQPVLSGLEEIEQYRAISAWEKNTATGDRAELAELPEASLLWHKLDARADTCTGQKCSEFERCFITEMRRRAMESDIIIVNHHLFFADLAIKLQADGAPDAGILPDAAAVIFDEAHELEDVAGNYFGISVSNLRVEELSRDIERSMEHNKLLSSSLSGALGSLRDRSQLFFSLLPAGDGRSAFETRREFLEENGDEFIGFNQALTRLRENSKPCRKSPKKSSTSFAARKKFRCNSAMRWSLMIATPSSGSSDGADRFRLKIGTPRRKQLHFRDAKMYFCRLHRSTSAHPA